MERGGEGGGGLEGKEGGGRDGEEAGWGGGGREGGCVCVGGEEESQTFRVFFGRPGMMDRIGFGNLISSFDAKEKQKGKKKNNKRKEKN